MDEEARRLRRCARKHVENELVNSNEHVFIIFSLGHIPNFKHSVFSLPLRIIIIIVRNLISERKQHGKNN